MPTQNYENHTQRVAGFLALGAILALTFIGSIVNLWKSVGDHQRLYSASLLVVLAGSSIVLGFYARTFALKAQDRAIRAEENLRHFAITGKLLDPRLDIKQVIALRFAGDDEFVALCKRAADESMPQDAIKRAVKNWRADFHRA